MTHQHNQQGFSLIEVMIAVGVIALAIPAALYAMQSQLEGAMLLRDKVQAQWVVDNHMTDIRLVNRATGTLPQAGKEQVTMLNQTWVMDTEIKPFSTPGLGDIYGIKIQVWLEEKQNTAPQAVRVGVIQSFDMRIISRNTSSASQADGS